MLETSIQDEVRKKLSDSTASLQSDASDSSLSENTIWNLLRNLKYSKEAFLLTERQQGEKNYSTWFLNLWLCRMLHWLNKKHPEDTKGGKLEIIDSIIKGLISTYVEIHEPTNVDYLLMIFTIFWFYRRTEGSNIQTCTSREKNSQFLKVLSKELI